MLLKACEAIKHEVGEGMESGLVDQLSEAENNEAYLHKHLESKSSKDKSSKEESSKNKSSKDDWLEKGSKCKHSDTKAVFVTASNN